MTIGKWLLLSCLFVGGLAFAGFIPQSYAATQKKNLVDDAALDCNGAVVGNVSVKKVGSGVLVNVKITNGAPNITSTILWVRQSGTECHVGSGQVVLGIITTDSHGKGKFKQKGHIPMDGSVHFSIVSPEEEGNYYAGIFSAP